MTKNLQKSPALKISLLAVSSLLALTIATSGAFARENHQGGMPQKYHNENYERGFDQRNYDRDDRRGNRGHERWANKHYRQANNYYFVNGYNRCPNNCHRAGHHHPTAGLLGFTLNFGF